MTDEPRQESQDPGLETIFNSSIGDDWGEAFEADDFMASPKENASSEFILPEEPTAGLAPPGNNIAPTVPLPATALPHGRLFNLGKRLTSRFCALSFPLRIATIASPILLALTLVLLLVGEKPDSPNTSHIETLPEKTVSIQRPETPVQQPATHQAETASPLPEEHPAVSTQPKDIALRKKWAFPAIIVEAKANSGQDITILSTDLTLVLKLPPEVLPPSAKDAFIREMIYQFYSNQPTDDLRRFALERGEMTRKLQAWIAKQWPGLPIDSITVDRYQLL